MLGEDGCMGVTLAARPELGEQRVGSGPSDEALEQSWRTGSRAAFSELFRRHYPGTVAYVRSFVGDHALAEDVAQQAFLNVLQRRAGKGRFQALIYTCARNLALNERRRQQRRYVARVGLEETDPVPSETTAPLGRLLEEEERAAFSRALADLPSELSEPFCLKETRGLTYGEVGRALGLHPDAVRRRVAKALELLRRALSVERHP